MAVAATPGVVDYEQAGELKIGQVGIANLRIRTLDVDRLAAEMRERVARAPKLFARAAVIVDFGALAATPDVAIARRLIDALRDAGVLPVALAKSVFKRYYEKLGASRYYVSVFLFLSMMSLPASRY